MKIAPRCAEFFMQNVKRKTFPLFLYHPLFSAFSIITHVYIYSKLGQILVLRILKQKKILYFTLVLFLSFDKIIFKKMFFSTIIKKKTPCLVQGRQQCDKWLVGKKTSRLICQEFVRQKKIIKNLYIIILFYYTFNLYPFHFYSLILSMKVDFKNSYRAEQFFLS